MIAVQDKLLSFEEFLEWLPENDRRYELIEGVIVELKPTGPHARVAGLIGAKMFEQIMRMQKPWFIPLPVAFVKPDLARAGYQPDILVLDDETLNEDPAWESSSTITRGESARVVVEVTSTNWKDDYLTKLRDYESMGIPEYWIVDYRALGAARYIGIPKRPTISIYRLVDGEYQVQQFQGSDRIVSPTFPDLELTVDQIVSLQG